MCIKAWLYKNRLAATAAATILSVSLVSLFAFQNCTSPPALEAHADVLKSTGAGEPFVFAANFDQLAYMSCTELRTGAFDTSAYFSFRLGAYRTGGVQILPSFFDSVKKFNLEDQQTILMDSQDNLGAQPQTALRSLRNFQQVFTETGSPAEGSDYQNMFGALTDPDNLTALFALNPADRLRYVPGMVVEGSRLEADLDFASSANMAESVRQFLSNDGVVALTYTANPNATIQTTGTLSMTGTITNSGQNSAIQARAPADFLGGSNTSSVYGRGLLVRFSQPSINGLYGQFPTSTLREVSEMNMLNQSDSSSLAPWVCPSSMRFRIVRKQDLAVPGANCIRAPDPDPLPSDLALVRNSFRVEDWYVDMTNLCIIPKKPAPDCYGNVQTVVYSMGAACAPGQTTGACVSMASVCYRQR